MEQPVAGDQVDDHGTFVEREEYCGEDCQRAIEEHENSQLRQIRNGKHGANYGDTEDAIGKDTVKQRLPQAPMVEEVEDSLPCWC